MTRPLRYLPLVVMSGFGLAFLGSAVAAPPRVEPGQWRLTWTLLSIKGTRGIPPEYLDLQTVTESRCLDRVPALPLPPGQDRGCQIDLESAVAETIRWQGSCQSPGGLVHTVTGTIHHRGTTLDGTLAVHNGTVTLEFEVRGRQAEATCR
ncbi:MAG TPA: hypothetical protein DIC36_01275 [Gammaproteobacteria bacterium]|nr:hypothetical protein [Gammaproteobacteria bacterium]